MIVNHELYVEALLIKDDIVGAVRSTVKVGMVSTLLLPTASVTVMVQPAYVVAERLEKVIGLSSTTALVVFLVAGQFDPKVIVHTLFQVNV